MARVYPNDPITPLLGELEAENAKRNGWEQIRLAEYRDYSSFYVEGWGLCKSLKLECGFRDAEGRRFEVYTDFDLISEQKCDDPLQLSYGSSDWVSSVRERLFDLKLYRLKNGVRLSYNQRLTFDQLEEIRNVTYCFELRGDVLISADRSWENRSKQFAVKTKEKFQALTVWAAKKRIESYVLPVWMDLHEGDRYYDIGGGECEIAEVYPYPDRASSKICRIVFANGQERDVEMGDEKLVCFPWNGKNELAQFNESLRELQLQPLMQREGHLVNVMWQPIEEAARYTVRLYRYVDVKHRRKVYFLKEYEADRNECFLSIGGVIGNGHILVVTAEDRAGSTVARSRGIWAEKNHNEPEWF